MGGCVFHSGIGCRGFRVPGNRFRGRGDCANLVFLFPSAIPDLPCRRVNAANLTFNTKVHGI